MKKSKKHFWMMNTFLDDEHVKKETIFGCNGSAVSIDIIETQLNSCYGIEIPTIVDPYDIPDEIINKWLKDENRNFRIAAMWAFKKRFKEPKTSLDTIEIGLADEDEYVREAAILICKGKKAPIEIIEKAVTDISPIVRSAAREVLKQKNGYVSEEIIDEWIKAGNLRAAVCAYEGFQDVLPCIIIKWGLLDENEYVRQIAVNLLLKFWDNYFELSDEYRT